MATNKYFILSVLISLTVCVLTVKPVTASGTARELAKQAYYDLEDNVFDSALVNAAIIKLQQVRLEDPKESWAYIAASQATLVNGYKIGDWFSMNTFEDGAVDKALALSKRAVELRPAESQASAQVARIYIIKKEYQAAWTLLNAAYANDKTNYYPWYLRGVIAVKMNDPKRAVVQFDEAEKLAKHKYQHRQLNYQRQYIAKMNGDAAAEEALLKKNIQDNPDRANIYGNYAQFLKKHNRYDEAIAYWEKAIAISPYPHAIEQLKKTKELKRDNRPR